jgi:hypothetical protein
MAINILCPRCQAHFFLPDDMGGKQARCSKCKTLFPVPPIAPATPNASAVNVSMPAVAPVTPILVPEPQLDEQLTAQPSAQPKSLPPAAGPPPRPSLRRRADRKEKSSKSMAVVVLVAVVVIGALALIPCLGIGGLYFWFRVAPVRPDDAMARARDVAIQPAPVAKDDVAAKDKVADPLPQRDEKKEFFPPIKDPQRTEEKKEFNPPLKDPGLDVKKEPRPPVVDKPPPIPAPDRSKVPIVPPKLEQERIVRELPGPIGDLCLGGAGRFVLCSIPSLRKIALFDVNEAKVVHYFPCADDNSAFAAGMTKLIMAFPGSGVIQRWDLVSRQKELTVNLPAGQQVKSLVMGSATEGPLLVVGNGRSFLDVRTFKPVAITESKGAFGGFGGSMFRMSADGTCFGSWEPAVSPQGLRIYTLQGFTLRSHYKHQSFGHIIPGPDGKFVYTARGIYTAEGQPVGKTTENAQSLYVLPAAQGDFYINLPLGNGELYKSGFTVHLTGDERPLVRVPYDLADFGRGPGASGVEAFNHWDREPFGNDKRIILIPDARLLLIIPFTNDRIVVKRFDIDEVMDKSGVDYLLVTSRPPALATPGKQYEYQLVVKAKKGGVKYKIDSGPDGMQVTPKGLVRWQVPTAEPPGEVNVILTVSDSAGQEAFHTFKLRVAAGP